MPTNIPSLHLIPSPATPPSCDLPLYRTLSLAKEGQSETVFSASKLVVRSLAALADDFGKPHKGSVLQKPRNQRIRHWHMLLHEAIECQMHRSNLTLEVPHKHLCHSRRLRIVWHRALDGGRMKLLHSQSLERVSDQCLMRISAGFWMVFGNSGSWRSCGARILNFYMFT